MLLTVSRKTAEKLTRRNLTLNVMERNEGLAVK